MAMSLLHAPSTARAGHPSIQEYPMRVSPLFLLLPLLAGCHDPAASDQSKTTASTFDRRITCAQLSESGKWENLPDGPFLDETYYSPSLDTCIFVLKQAFPAEKDGEIQNAYFIVDGLTRKQLWSNDPKKGETEEQLDAALNQELAKLQVGK
jgi:hypothetical protein